MSDNDSETKTENPMQGAHSFPNKMPAPPQMEGFSGPPRPGMMPPNVRPPLDGNMPPGIRPPGPFPQVTFFICGYS